MTEEDNRLSRIEKKIDKLSGENAVVIGDLIISSHKENLSDVINWSISILKNKSVKNYLNAYKMKKAIGVG